MYVWRGLFIPLEEKRDLLSRRQIESAQIRSERKGGWILVDITFTSSLFSYQKKEKKIDDFRARNQNVSSSLVLVFR